MGKIDTIVVAAPPSLRLDILLCHEDGAWVGHCLQLDVVSAGPTPDEAFLNTKAAALSQITYAFNHDSLIDTLFKPPEPELIEKVFKARSEGCLHVEVNRHDDRVGFEIQRLQEAA